MHYLRNPGKFAIKREAGVRYAKGGLLMPMRNNAIDISATFNNPKLTY